MSREKPSFSVRPPPSVEAFVSGERPSAQAAERPSAQTAEGSNVRALKRPDVQPPKGRAVVERADGRQLRRLTVYLPTELATRLRRHCADRDVDASDEIARAVAAMLDAP